MRLIAISILTKSINVFRGHVNVKFEQLPRNLSLNSQQLSEQQGSGSSGSSSSSSSSRPENPEEKARHKYQRERANNELNKSLVPKGLFENIRDKNKDTFLTTIELFQWKDTRARGHVEFNHKMIFLNMFHHHSPLSTYLKILVTSALGYMKQFGVHRDLETYKKLLDVFPKGKFQPQNLFQVEFLHYPKQQNCAIDVLDQMDYNSVIPDLETQELLKNIFGSQSHPGRKCQRMLYWMPKLKYKSPFKSLPEPFPYDNSLEIAKLAIEQMTSIDLQTKITIFNTKDLEDAQDDTWIVSGQSPAQIDLIESHSSDKPIYVEGAFRMWIAKACVNYFILRAEPKPPPPSPSSAEIDDVSNLKELFNEEFNESRIIKKPSVHEQEDGIILAVCATGSSSKDSLVSWIRSLQETNQRLGKDISVVFTLKSPIGPTDDLEVLDENDADKTRTIDPNEQFQTLGLDSKHPELHQMGIGEFSDTKFINWPHNHNPKSINARKSHRIEQFKNTKKPSLINKDKDKSTMKILGQIDK